jgi:DNA-binding transcriptional LysR family regulator
MSAVLDGVGIAYVLDAMAAPYLAQGQLVALLGDWSSTLPGVFLYCPSRRQMPVPLRVFIDFIKEWRKGTRNG